MSEMVFSTDSPEIVSAFQEARIAERAAAVRAVEDAVALGKNKGPLIVRGIWDIPDRVVGLAPDDPDDPPAGWVYVKTRDRLEPRRFAAGQEARDWLAAHQPVDVRKVMTRHGLPRNSRSAGSDSGSYHLSPPTLFEYEGTLWARYRGVVDEIAGECSWTPRKLSEFYAAYEVVLARG